MPATPSQQDQMNIDKASESKGIKSDDVVSNEDKKDKGNTHKNSKNSNKAESQRNVEKNENDNKSDSKSNSDNDKTQKDTETSQKHIEHKEKQLHKTFMEKVTAMIGSVFTFIKKIFFNFLKIIDFIMIMFQQTNTKSNDLVEIKSVDAEKIVGTSAVYVVSEDKIHSKLAGRPSDKVLSMSSAEFAAHVIETYTKVVPKLMFDDSTSEAKVNAFMDIKLKSDNDESDDDLQSRLSALALPVLEVLQDTSIVDAVVSMSTSVPLDIDDIKVTNDMLDEIYESIYNGALSSLEGKSSDVEEFYAGYLSHLKTFAYDFVGSDMFHSLNVYHSWPCVLAANLSAALANLILTDEEVKIQNKDIAKVSSAVAIMIYMSAIRPDQITNVTRWIKDK